MAVGTLVFDKSSYENVVCLGHILAEDGRKMSKHLGNILQPIPLMDQHGADAVRWFMAAGGSPWAARRVGHGTIQEVVRKTLLTYWNTVAFQALYARTSNWAPSAADPAPADRTVLDRWLLSELNALVDQVTQATGGATTPSAPASSSPRSWTTCPTGTYAAPAAASGRATRPRCAPCTTSSRRSPG